jgi:hypothetical protein
MTLVVVAVVDAVVDTVVDAAILLIPAVWRCLLPWREHW